ncbi:hypothetical protein STEG23_009082, partial [Scotinomys teguina]
QKLFFEVGPEQHVYGTTAALLPPPKCIAARTWKQPKCPSTEEWIRKMLYIYTMEYYAAEKNNGIMKFAGKWMELENVILSEILVDLEQDAITVVNLEVFINEVYDGNHFSMYECS